MSGIPSSFGLQDHSIPPPPETAPPPPSTRCGNCQKEGVKSQCMRCERVVYCNGECQKADWKFHKRICEKPKAAVPASAAPTPPQPSPSVGGGSSSAAAPAAASAPMVGGGGSSASAAAASSSASSKNTEVVRDEDLDEEDLAALAAVRKTGYRVHWRKAEEEAAIRSAIGDIAPKRVVEPVGGSAAAPQAAAPTLVAAAATSSAATTSAWNSAGTMEQKHMGDWLFEKLRALLAGVPAATLPGDGGSLKCTGGVSNVGDSTADILMARGKTKRVYDLHFSVVLEHSSGSKVHLNFLDVSNTSEGEQRAFKVELQDNSLAAPVQEAIKAALQASGTGAGAELIKGTLKAVEDAVAAFMQL